jgi:hypothetical protein
VLEKYFDFHRFSNVWNVFWSSVHSRPIFRSGQNVWLFRVYVSYFCFCSQERGKRDILSFYHILSRVSNLGVFRSSLQFRYRHRAQPMF